MDIIFTNADWTSDYSEVGVLEHIQLDYDSTGDMDFELTVTAEDAKKIELGALWYVQGTEFGGLIEGFKSSSTNSNVTFTGTNTRGLLNRKIIPGAKRTVVVDGVASDIISAWIDKYGLSSLVEVEAILDGDGNFLDIPIYEFPAYTTTIYKAIVGLLDTVNYVPTFTWEVPTVATEDDDNESLLGSFVLGEGGGILIDRAKSDPRPLKIKIAAELRRDLSDEIQYTGSQAYSFQINQTTDKYNHYVAVAYDGTKRYVCRIFTDSSGGIINYLKDGVDEPLQDSDYVIDTSRRQISGAKESIFAFEASAGFVENYIPLEESPSDWKKNFDAYYEYDDENDNYQQAEAVTSSEYTLLSKQPKDWLKGYGNYYTKNTSGKYIKIKATTQAESYKKLKSKPSDWAKKYSNYYVDFNDGTKVVKERVSGVTYYSYKKQTSKPSDWATNYNNYYKVVKKKYVRVEGVEKKSGTVAPKWTKNKYYTRFSKRKAPVWSTSSTYYSHTKKTTVVPTFAKNKYYVLQTITRAPSFDDGIFYKKVIDHYSGMIEEIKNLIYFTYRGSQTAKIMLIDSDARIGDLVGCYDEATNTDFVEAVTNIIYKISGANENKDYRLGGA